MKSEILNTVSCPREWEITIALKNAYAYGISMDQVRYLLSGCKTWGEMEGNLLDATIETE